MFRVLCQGVVITEEQNKLYERWLRYFQNGTKCDQSGVVEILALARALKCDLYGKEGVQFPQC